MAQALRTGATRAARAAGGGVVLVFEAGDADELRLRAAAGFSAPDQARAAGAALAPQIGEAMRGTGACEIDVNGLALGPRAAGGVRVHPVVAGSQRHGAVVVVSLAVPDCGADRPPRGDRRHDRDRLDHARLARECADLQARAAGPAPDSAGQSDEVLRLSEALFAQDIELLRNTEKLGKIERLKDDFIEKMSRELRTP